MINQDNLLGDNNYIPVDTVSVTNIVKSNNINRILGIANGIVYDPDDFDKPTSDGLVYLDNNGEWQPVINTSSPGQGKYPFVLKTYDNKGELNSRIACTYDINKLKIYNSKYFLIGSYTKDKLNQPTYIESGLYYSDNGIDWELVLHTPDDSSYSNLNLYYAQDTYFVYTNKGIWRSKDGKLWTNVLKNNITCMCEGDSSVDDKYSSDSAEFSNISEMNKVILAGCEYGGLWYSVDTGSTWNLVTRSNFTYNICIGENTSIAVASGNSNGIIFSNDDGVTWNQSEISSGTYRLYYANNKFYAGGSNRVLCSNDGLTWIETNDSNGEVFIGDFNSMVYNLGTYVIGNNLGIFYSNSEDTISWTSSDLNTEVSSICYGDNKFIAAGANGIYYSTDGIHWTQSNVVGIITTEVKYNNDKFIALSDAGILISNNGTIWNQTNIKSPGFINLSCSGNISIASNEYGIWYSNGGYNWYPSDLFMGEYNICSIKSFYGSVFVASSMSNKGLFYSVNGSKWMKSNITGGCYGIDSNKGKFIAGGNKGIFYSSASENEPQGSKWIRSKINYDTDIIYDYHPVELCYGDGVFIMIDVSGDINYSTDNGETWDTAEYLEGASRLCYSNGKFFSVRATHGGAYQIFYTKILVQSKVLMNRARLSEVIFDTIDSVEPNDSSEGITIASSSESGELYYSNNMCDWIIADSNRAQLTGLSKVNNKLLAGSSNNKGILYSLNASKWNSTNISTGNYKICYGNGIIVACGISNEGVLYSIDNGLSWIQSNLTIGSYPFICYGNGVFIIGNDKLWYSTNGSYWIQSDLPLGNLNYLKFNGKSFTAANSFSYISFNNGRNWTRTESKSNNYLGNISSSYGRIKITESGNTNYKDIYLVSDNNGIWYSFDGFNYELSDYKFSGISSISFGNNQFTAVSNNSLKPGIIYSDNGINWNQTNVNDNRFTDIKFINGRFIAYNKIDSGVGVFISDDSSDIDNSKIMYALNNYNQIYKSMNQGRSWILEQTNLHAIEICYGNEENNGNDVNQVTASGLENLVETNYDLLNNNVSTPNKFYIGSNCILTSMNGGVGYIPNNSISWIQSSFNDSSHSTTLNNIIKSDMSVNSRKLLSIVPNDGIYYSTDGISWIGSNLSKHINLSQNNLDVVEYSYDCNNIYFANKFLVMCSESIIINGVESIGPYKIYYSTDGSMWSSSNNSPSNSDTKFYYNNNRYFCYNSEGIWYSDSGNYWTKVLNENINKIVSSSNNNIVSSGPEGLWFSSDNGTNWTRSVSAYASEYTFCPNASNLCYGDGIFLVIVSGGYYSGKSFPIYKDLWYSKNNGNSWYSVHGDGINRNYLDIAYNSNIFYISMFDDTDNKYKIYYTKSVI